MTSAFIIGCGLIGRSIACKLAIEKLFQKVVIIDQKDYDSLVQEIFQDTDIEYQFYQFHVTPESLEQLRNMIKDNEADIVIDCSYNIETLDLISNLPEGVGYINTSVEEWPTENGTPVYSTLRKRQLEIQHWYNHAKPYNNILLDCGMNPGLVNLWAWDCVRKNFDSKFDSIEQVLVSEVDTQKPITPRKEGEFVNTWSPNGFLEEVHAPVEGYSLGEYFSDDSVTGYETISRSIRPSGEPFFGFTVRHAETITMNKLFKNATLMYIYRCPESAIASLFEYQEVVPIKSERLMYTDLVSEGIDELGVVMTDGNKLVWYGSLLGNDEVKRQFGKRARFVNATSVQVLGGLWIGINYLLKLQNQTHVYRLLTPEDITEDETFLEDILSEVNVDLQMSTVEFSRDHVEAKKIMRNKSFPQHFKTFKALA